MVTEQELAHLKIVMALSKKEFLKMVIILALKVSLEILLIQVKKKIILMKELK